MDWHQNCQQQEPQVWGWVIVVQHGGGRQTGSPWHREERWWSQRVLQDIFQIYILTHRTVRNGRPVLCDRRIHLSILGTNKWETAVHRSGERIFANGSGNGAKPLGDEQGFLQSVRVGWNGPRSSRRSSGRLPRGAAAVQGWYPGTGVRRKKLFHDGRSGRTRLPVVVSRVAALFRHCHNNHRCVRSCLLWQLSSSQVWKRLIYVGRTEENYMEAQLPVQFCSFQRPLVAIWWIHLFAQNLGSQEGLV